MWNNYRLTKLRSPISVYDIASFDIETHNNNKSFSLGGFFDSRYHCFYDRLEMQKYIEENIGSKTIIFATNLGFDFNALCYGTKAFFQYKKLMRNGNMILCRKKSEKYDNRHYKKNSIVMSDTLNFTPSSVEALGKTIGIKKLHHPKSLGRKPKTENEWAYLKRYNRGDCLITKRFMEEFQKLTNSLGGELKTTIASTAMNLYRRKFMPREIGKEYCNVKDFIYESYYGGRVEAFSRGKLPRLKYRVYDYNSLYPSVMLKKYPLPQSGRLIKGTIKHIKKYEGVSRVKIYCPYMKYPLLPYRDTEEFDETKKEGSSKEFGKGKLLFPYGTFTGIYTHIELREAIKAGYKIIKIYKTLYYTKTFYPFRKWVKTLYALRKKYQQEGNKIYEVIIKLYMNSLYGKFGMKYIEDIEFFDMTEEEYTQEELLGMDVYNEEIGYKTEEKEAGQNYIMPIFASYTTAYGRIKLWNAMIKYRPIYVDTDSLFTDEKIPESKELGELKLEKEILEGYIIKPKAYYIRDLRLEEKLGYKEYVKLKGFHKANEQMLKDILCKKSVRQEKFLKLKEAIKRRRVPNEKIIMMKYMDLEDDKREWEKPFNIEELQESRPRRIGGKNG